MKHEYVSISDIKKQTLTPENVYQSIAISVNANDLKNSMVVALIRELKSKTAHYERMMKMQELTIDHKTETINEYVRITGANNILIHSMQDEICGFIQAEGKRAYVNRISKPESSVQFLKIAR